MEQSPDQEVGENMPNVEPSIYVASLADYNEGRLHGIWIKAAQEPEDIQEEILEMLNSSPIAAEEWAIHDYEGFNGIRLSEYERLETVSQLAQGINEHGAPFAIWTASQDLQDSTVDRFESAYLGEWPSLEDYASQMFDDLGYEQMLDEVIPSNIQPYVTIDYAAFARDLQLGGDVYIEPSKRGIYVFDNRV